MVCGAVGLLWVPLWLYAARTIPSRVPAPSAQSMPVQEMFRDRRYWGLIVANMLYMTLYTLWANWTTLYFVEARGLTQDEANLRYAWIPPVLATAGGLAGGAAAFRLIRAGVGVTAARMRICWVSAVLLLTTAAVPLMPTPGWAAAAISFSYFWTLCISTNVYAMPIDYFGVSRAAFGVASLTFAYGLMQAFISPVIGRIIDLYGFSRVCAGSAILPLLGVAVLQATRRAE